jgi:hypothetical protein
MDPGTLLPPGIRAAIYVISVALAAAYAVFEANIDLHFGWQAGYASWNAAVGALAVSNVKSNPEAVVVVQPPNPEV